jgi:threonine synthase
LGNVTSAAIALTDGSTVSVSQPDELLFGSEEGPVELGYEYSTSLLPDRQAPSEGLWRWRGLLPLDDHEIKYPLQVGSTPMIAPRRLRSTLEMPRLHLKDETRGPTGSNKDRATALVTEHALRRGMRAITCASTGNVAASLAVGAAAAGLDAIIFVPAAVDEAKLRLMLAAGATVIKVAAGYETAFRLSRAAARRFGWCDRNTGVNPLTVEAKKTVAFEIWEDLGRQVPDLVVAPVGDGPTLNALAKGFRELRSCGASDRVPRVVGVQAEGCQPVKRAWESGRPVEVSEPRTIADGIAVGAPVSAALVVRDVKEGGGGLVAVSDEEMLDGISELASAAGVIAEPAGAAAFAGVRAAIRAGLLDRDERLVVLVTGSGLKTPQYLHPAGRTTDVDSTLEEVEEALPKSLLRLGG